MWHIPGVSVLWRRSGSRLRITFSKKESYLGRCNLWVLSPWLFNMGNQFDFASRSTSRRCYIQHGLKMSTWNQSNVPQVTDLCSFILNSPDPEFSRLWETSCAPSHPLPWVRWGPGMGHPVKCAIVTHMNRSCVRHVGVLPLPRSRSWKSTLPSLFSRP